MEPNGLLAIVALVPVAVVMLVWTRMVSIHLLREWRRWAIVTIFAISAVLTPPDPFSHIAMAMSMVLLYELSILALE